MKVPYLKLADGREIPQVGLGLWRVKDETEFKISFDTGLAAGYTHFDSAQAYENEQFLGKCWVDADLKREDIWLTTKVRTEIIAVGKTAWSVPRSLARLQTDYVDLLLLHFPVSIARKKAWKELEKIKADGGAKSIGVSNYTVKHLEEMKLYATEMPVVNQVELHVFLQQPELLEYCRENNIAVEAYSPLAHGKKMDDPTIIAIAQKHHKSYAQIMLRWCIEKGLVVLPKSITPERIQQNINIFDFELDAEDMNRLAQLDQSLRTCWDPTRVP
ncbi:aldo/keto reductase [Candidatus Saccharibacteria bacterium]|nr:MAG: aldo/keto reductase [Candidatus Saccharibacteria bacterium]